MLFTVPQGIINKKNCGCGLTSLAIEDKYPTVIFVPTVEIIKNKEAQYPNDRCNHFLFGLAPPRPPYERGENQLNYLLPPFLRGIEGDLLESLSVESNS